MITHIISKKTADEIGLDYKDIVISLNGCEVLDFELGTPNNESSNSSMQENILFSDAHDQYTSATES